MFTKDKIGIIMFSEPFIINFNELNINENINLVNDNFDKNIFGYNVSDKDYCEIQKNCPFVKYNEIAGTISAYNNVFTRSTERVGIICNNESDIQIMEELFECLIIFGLKGRRIPIFENSDRVSDVYTCDVVISIGESNFDLKNIKTIEYTNSLENIINISNIIHTLK